MLKSERKVAKMQRASWRARGQEDDSEALLKTRFVSPNSTRLRAKSLSQALFLLFLLHMYIIYFYYTVNFSVKFILNSKKGPRENENSQKVHKQKLKGGV